MKNDLTYDAIVIGGSYAGLSAAMALGRALRHVVIIDSGNPCNLRTPHAHNFLTQDGKTPVEITSIALHQALQYPTISLVKDLAVNLLGKDGQFRIMTKKNGTFKAKKVLFATGLKDIVSPIPGMADCWGISVIHCPYCHGYEYRGLATGILINGDAAIEMGRLIRNWTPDLFIFTDGPSQISEVHQSLFDAWQIPVIEYKIAEVVHKDGYLDRIFMHNGQVYPLKALYARFPLEQQCDLPEAIGCHSDEQGYLVLDTFQKTNIPGIFAAGDNSNRMRSVSNAAAAGNRAGAFINHELIAEAYPL